MPGATRVLAFLLVFAALLLLALAATVVSEFHDVEWLKVTIRIGEGLGRLTLVSVAIAFILVEGVPMLAAWLKREMVREAEEKGRAEVWGIWQRWQIDLEAWEERRAAAVSEGSEFGEPRPEPPQPKA